MFETIGILGGTGFVGQNLVGELTRRGHPTRVLTRHRERHRELLVFPTCEVVEADVHSAAVLATHLRGCDAVVNLVGILNQGRSPRRSFFAVHADLPRKLGESCLINGISRILHVSALNAGPHGPSEYLKTKGAGERAAHAWADEGIAVTSFRPSVLFGPHDTFINRFAALLAISPVVFPLACPDARFAPVFVSDLVAAMIATLDDAASPGQAYELGGAREYSLREIVEYVAETAGMQRRIIGLGDTLSSLQARVMGLGPEPPFSYDNYLSLQVESVCEGENGFDRLGIVPTSLETVVPNYLGARNRSARNARYRTVSRRG